MVNVEINISIEDCRTLNTAVCDAIQYWPGSPARPAEEQEFLWAMIASTRRCLLDHSFHNS